MTNIIKTKHLAKANDIKPICNMESLEDSLSNNPDYFTYVDEFGWPSYIKLSQKPDTSRCGCQRPSQSCSLCRTDQENNYFRMEKAQQLKDEESQNRYNDLEMEVYYDEEY